MVPIDWHLHWRRSRRLCWWGGSLSAGHRWGRTHWVCVCLRWWWCRCRTSGCWLFIVESGINNFICFIVGLMWVLVDRYNAAFFSSINLFVLNERCCCLYCVFFWFSCCWLRRSLLLYSFLSFYIFNGEEPVFLFFKNLIALSLAAILGCSVDMASSWWLLFNFALREVIWRFIDVKIDFLMVMLWFEMQFFFLGLARGFNRISSRLWMWLTRVCRGCYFCLFLLSYSFLCSDFFKIGL